MKFSKPICVIIILLLVSCKIVEQELDKSSVLVITSSVTQIPADAIYFSITLSSQSEDPQKAFDDHKILEKNLLNLFKKFEIADSNVSYSLFL